MKRYVVGIRDLPQEADPNPYRLWLDGDGKVEFYDTIEQADKQKKEIESLTAQRAIVGAEAVIIDLEKLLQ